MDLYLALLDETSVATKETSVYEFLNENSSSELDFLLLCYSSAKPSSSLANSQFSEHDRFIYLRGGPLGLLTGFDDVSRRQRSALSDSELHLTLNSPRVHHHQRPLLWNPCHY